MPATAKTYRNQRMLHRIFAVSGTVLLATTVWMIADDHWRPWKRIQRQAEQIRVTTAEWRAEGPIAERRSTYFTWYGYLPLPGRRWLELPLLDAFNSPRKIETIWHDGLDIDYNFRKVRRFDRCTTCHGFSDKTAPGSADQPAVPGEQWLEFELPWPSDPIADGVPRTRAPVAGETPAGDELAERLGVRLAAEGLLEPNAVTVQFVQPESVAARATLAKPEADRAPRSGRSIREGLLRSADLPANVPTPRRGLIAGDVLLRINGQPVANRDDAVRRLLAAAAAREPLTVAVRRGLPSPFATHPRLDLFVASASPHPQAVFGCTICHEGQGSATDFKWASHTPNDAAQRAAWRGEHRWFDNPDWGFPMHPRRFAESGCLKCHYEMGQLAAGGRFAEPPAPKLSRGYQLILALGCFGCHDLSGYRAEQRVAPDLRTEPNYAAVAQQLKADPGFAAWDATQQADIEELVQNPERDAVRRRIREQLVADAADAEPRFTRDTHARLGPLLKDVDRPGTLRRVGPSLRSVGSKSDKTFLYDWIRQPDHFRPDTRMPRAFGLWHHLDGPGKAIAERFEPLEILGMVTYLQTRSQKSATLDPLPGATKSSAQERAARGKVLLQERGCLACHRHRDFADAEPYRDPEDIVLGPDLSSLAQKLAADGGRQWLYAWIKQPARYDPRTLMPESLLDPVPTSDGGVSDPVDDLVEYLLASSTSDWKPAPSTLAFCGDLGAEQLAALDDLTSEYLRDTLPPADAAEFARTGIPASYGADLKGAEVELLVRNSVRGPGSPPLGTEPKLLYVGRKALGRAGCCACHDIPGLEDAKPIGPELAGWGRKDEQQLAFESVLAYLEGPGHGDPPATPADLPDFYLLQIKAGQRAGFAFQKLREPRSYDFRRTENKRFTERLRMPQFALGSAEREAIVTYLLGLTADPPTSRYVCVPDAKRQAEIEGRAVLDQYRCKACHILEPERWSIAFAPGDLPSQPDVSQYPFQRTLFPARDVAASRALDAAGLSAGVVEGLPTLDDDGLPRVFDEDGLPLDGDAEYPPDRLEHALDLWRPTVLGGNRYEVGVMPLNLPARMVDRRLAADGGFLARYLLAPLVERERRGNPNVKGAEAWGWLPPPLIGEGRKVQTSWLYDYLLNPAPVRPAAVMRMPRFNFSAEQATRLVRYFAAVDGAEYPYEFRSRRQPAHLVTAENRYQERLRQDPSPPRPTPTTRLDDAMRIVTDANYCIKCHRVADFDPQVAARSKAPDLSLVHQRLRPEYVRNWIANPKTVLPYTGMPVNIPYDAQQPNLGGIDQRLYHGTSLEQLEALVDLLMNYDEYAKLQSPVAPHVGRSPAGETTVPGIAPNLKADDRPRRN